MDLITYSYAMVVAVVLSTRVILRLHPELQIRMGVYLRNYNAGIGSIPDALSRDVIPLLILTAAILLAGSPHVIVAVVNLTAYWLLLIVPTIHVKTSRKILLQRALEIVYVGIAAVAVVSYISS